MTNQKLAIGFVRKFCSGDVEGLESLLSDSLRFRGPFHRFDSRDAYLSCLSDDSPTPHPYEVISVTENDEQVAVFYEYQKPDRTVTIAQLFKIENGMIAEMLLVFDGRGFGDE